MAVGAHEQPQLPVAPAPCCPTRSLTCRDDGPLGARAIRAALDQDLLEVHYQPVVVLPSRHVVGFEALARLRLPDGRLVQPAAVHPRGGAQRARRPARPRRAAQGRRGRRPLARRDLARRHRDGQRQRRPAPARGAGFLDVVRAVLADHDLPGSALVLEITESVATSGRVRPLLEQLVGARRPDRPGRLRHRLRHPRQPAPAARPGAQARPQLRRRRRPAGHRPGDRPGRRRPRRHPGPVGRSPRASRPCEQADVLLRLGCAHVQGVPVRPARTVAGDGRRRGRHGARTAASRGPAAATTRRLGPGARRRGARRDPAARRSRRTAARAAVHAVAPRAARRRRDGRRAPSGRSAGWRSSTTCTGSPWTASWHRRSRGTAPAAARVGARAARRAGRARRPPGRPGRWRPGTAAPVHAAVRGEPELHLLLHAVEAVTAGGRRRPGAGAGGDLGRAARRRRAATPPRSTSAMPAGDPVVPLLTALSLDPPDLVPLDDLLDDLDRRRLGRRGMEERLRSLVGITRVLAGSRDIRELLRVALEEVRRIVGAASASLERWEREAAQLRTLVNVGAARAGRGDVPAGRDVRARGVRPDPAHHARAGCRTSTPSTTPDADPRPIALLRALHKYSSAAIPIYLEGRVWGQLWLTTEVGEPPFGVARHRAAHRGRDPDGRGRRRRPRTCDRVARLAFEDPLTRVGNRRAVDDALERARGGRPAGRRSCCSTSTCSSRSTTPRGTPSATRR